MPRADLPVASSWYNVHIVRKGLALIEEPHVDPLLRCNMWYLRGNTADLLIDSGLGIVPLAPTLSSLETGRKIMAVATHAHLDHTGAMHEFEERAVHEAEAAILEDPVPVPLIRSDIEPEAVAMFERAGYPIGDCLLTAAPHPSFDPGTFAPVGAVATEILSEGSALEIGDFRLSVLHLPGHSPGSIGLFDGTSGILFSGDAIYDGPLLDELPESSIADYSRTMRLLLDLPVRAVYPGHGPVLTRQRLHEIAQTYLARRGGPGTPQ